MQQHDGRIATAIRLLQRRKASTSPRRFVVAFAGAAPFMRQTVSRLAFAVTVSVVAAGVLACGGHSTTAPSPGNTAPAAGPVAHPNLSIVAVAVVGEPRTPSGYTYRATVRLRETA